jgi:hypothetical protein
MPDAITVRVDGQSGRFVDKAEAKLEHPVETTQRDLDGSLCGRSQSTKVSRVFCQKLRPTFAIRVGSARG